jgi:tetratricopeptide (TPR) repeat protein
MNNRTEILEQFVEEDPNDSFSRYALALELEKAGDREAAVGQLREVLERDGSYVAAYYHLGRLLATLGRTDESRTVYSEGLKVAEKAGETKTVSEIREALEQLSL